jgi:iron complex outermembrane receptor protein
MAADDANTAWSPAYTVADVRVGSEALRVGAVAVALTGGVQNVGATRYNASVVVNAFGRRYYEPGPARTFHVGATISAPTRPR